MCQIFIPENRRCDIGILDRERKYNDDGAGIMIYNSTENGGNWTIRKAVDCTEETLLNWIEEAESAENWAIHFRRKTHGSITEDNCHPFDLGSGFWLMHNGTLSWPASDPKSDTRSFADWVRESEIMSRGFDANADLFHLVCGSSRFAIACPDGIIYRLGKWNKEPEGYYSSWPAKHYQNYSTSQTTYTPTTTKTETVKNGVRYIGFDRPENEYRKPLYDPLSKDDLQEFDRMVFRSSAENHGDSIVGNLHVTKAGIEIAGYPVRWSECFFCWEITSGRHRGWFVKQMPNRRYKLMSKKEIKRLRNDEQRDHRLSAEGRANVS